MNISTKGGDVGLYVVQSVEAAVMQDVSRSPSSPAYHRTSSIEDSGEMVVARIALRVVESLKIARRFG